MMTIRSLFLVSALFTSTTLLAQSKVDIQVRTNRVDDKVIAVTNDGRFFAIVCSHAWIPGRLMPSVSKSSAVMILPNNEGDIVTENYNKPSRSIIGTPKSDFIVLSDLAMSKICNEPNGFYVLRILQKSDARVVEYVSDGSKNAFANQRDLGY